MSRRIVLATFVALTMGAYVAVAPYLTVRSMRIAAEQRDGEQLSEHIDFPSVRQSLKEQMNAMMLKDMNSDVAEAQALAVFGTALMGSLVEKLVDAYVTPAGITQLMAGEGVDADISDEPSSDPLEGATMSYASFNKFTVTVPGESDGGAKFVLRRDGLTWKLTEILLLQGE